MARKKKTVSQKIVGVATTGMPSPVRKFLGAKLVAGLIVLAVPVLFATGTLKLEWHDGRPKISFNESQAGALRQGAAEKIEEVREDGLGIAADGGVLGDREGNEKVEKAFQETRDFFKR